MADPAKIRTNPYGSILGGVYVDSITGLTAGGGSLVTVIRYIADAEHNERYKAGLEPLRELQLFVDVNSSQGWADAITKAKIEAEAQRVLESKKAN
jgi:hypothetical protein